MEVLELLSLRALENPSGSISSPIDASFFAPPKDVVDNDRVYTEHMVKRSIIARDLQVRTQGGSGTGRHCGDVHARGTGLRGRGTCMGKVGVRGCDGERV